MYQKIGPKKNQKKSEKKYGTIYQGIYQKIRNNIFIFQRFASFANIIVFHKLPEKEEILICSLYPFFVSFSLEDNLLDVIFVQMFVYF